MSGTSGLLQLRVVRRDDAGDGVALIDLVANDGSTLPGWEPGAHIDLATQDDAGNSVMRQYSLCGPSGAPAWRIAVLADPRGRGGSRWLHQNLRPETVLQARGPRNHFRLEPGREPVVLVAGGIGITPLLAMARELHASQREFRLHYHVRRRSAAAFLRELQQQPWAERVHPSIDEEGGVPVQQVLRPDDAPGWVYTCGPAPFMDAVAASATAAGVSAHKIRRELFTADPSPQAAPASGEFSVRLQRSGQEIRVSCDQTVVHALAQAGVDVIVSCEQGHCGSCLTRILDGVPEHRDQFLLPEERERNDVFTPCCSRSLSPILVLDL